MLPLSSDEKSLFVTAQIDLEFHGVFSPADSSSEVKTEVLARLWDDLTNAGVHALIIVESSPVLAQAR